MTLLLTPPDHQSSTNQRNVTIHASIPFEKVALTVEVSGNPIRRLAVSDYIYRQYRDTVMACWDKHAPLLITLPKCTPGKEQLVLSRSCVSISSMTSTIELDIAVSWGVVNRYHDTADNRIHATTFLQTTLPNLLAQFIQNCQLDTASAVAHWQCVEDQCALRNMLHEKGGVCFVANNSILPRAGGSDDRPLVDDNVVSFVSPSTLSTDFVLPNHGLITGMLIPHGITIITGGGYHGKSTILRAISFGNYNKIPGDGREFVVTVSNSIGIRSEDGRFVSGVNISPFIDNLPDAAAIDPRNFSTTSASGSTSMAANIMEFMELSPQLFLLDEDTCASNFMIRDSRMRSMIANEPITPLIYRVNALYKQKDISSIVVIGGSGDWFDVQDTTIMMDNYRCLDMSKRARSISKTFCTGRVEFNGRGLVHQLPWPELDDDEEYRGKYSTRHLIALLLPMQRLSVSADDDGHSITFVGENLHTITSNETNNETVSIRIDLSKLEQRIATQAGALGIALAVLFCAEMVRQKSMGQSQELIILLHRFQQVQGVWSDSQGIWSDHRNRNDTDKLVEAETTSYLVAPMDELYNEADDSNSQPKMSQVEEDYQIVVRLHRTMMGGKHFIWPRMFEALAAVNRLTTARFSTAILTNPMSSSHSIVRSQSEKHFFLLSSSGHGVTHGTR